MASDSDLVNGDTIKAEAIQLIESHIDLSEALAEVRDDRAARYVRYHVALCYKITCF